MVDLLFIHILSAVLLFASLAARLITNLKGKNFTSLRIATYALTASQVLSGVALIFNGASLVRVCIPGVILVTVVILSDFALNRIYRSKTNDSKSNQQI